MMFEGIKGIIFDYGGTLDSEGRHWSHILREGLAAAKIKVDDDAWREAYVYAERYLAKEPLIKPDDTFREVMLKKVALETEYIARQGLVPELKEDMTVCVNVAAGYCYSYAKKHVEQSRNVLEKLKTRYPMVLVTNFYGNIHAVLRDFCIEDMFCGVVESSVVGVRKPDPKIYCLGVDLLNVPSCEVLVVGDSFSKDIEPAASIGCKTVWLKGEGWNNETAEPTLKPGAVINSVEQLIDLIP